MSRAGVFLRKQLWIWPIIAIVILSVLGLYVRSAIESTMKSNLESELRTLLDVEVAMLEGWYDVQASHAETAANDLEFRKLVSDLLEPQNVSSSTQELPEDNSQEIYKLLAPWMQTHGFVGYFITDRTKKIVAASDPVLVGQSGIRQYDHFVSRALDGEFIVSAPFKSIVMLDDEFGQRRSGQPIMYASSPIRDETFHVLGTLCLQLRPEAGFTKILQRGRIGKTGETYAFNSEGVMISNSRFDEELILLGVLADDDQASSILSVQIRNPGGDMTTGYRPKIRRAEMPLTSMAAAALSKTSGVNVDGYRDYRGVNVVGGWAWLPEFEIGVATEIDQSEAFLPLTILRRAFWFMYGLLVISAVAIFVFTVIVARMQRDARNAAIEAKQLGQYTLEQKLGSGAMGVVYRGHHAMLRRPTAIKLLDTEKVDDQSIQRFEREVQITCRLNHPSTIAIFDFGRTPEGVFYYAMEYLDGINLQQLIEEDGPQTPGRVISILLQACGSLYEAHAQGLVHRDIKPANIMLCRRGGQPDVCKVLDFGLVKAIDEEEMAGMSTGHGLTGTPLYMSPEAIQAPTTVDGRSDIYAIGAVGYFLLTGRPVFDASSIVDLCHKHVEEQPESPRDRLNGKISTQLEHAILSCLEKVRSKRPQTARDLIQLLKACPEAAEWTWEMADAWWGHHDRHGQVIQHTHDTNKSQSYLDRTIVHDS